MQLKEKLQLLQNKVKNHLVAFVLDFMAAIVGIRFWVL